MIVILMGVSASGKTTVGRMLAEQMGWPFYDGDDFHPPANIEKMHRGIPLTEEDRIPWLEVLHSSVDGLLAQGRSAVIACSALTRFDRQELVGGDRGVYLIYLHASYELIRRRLAERHGHFFSPALLDSQFATLQEPDDVFTVNAAQEPQAIVDEIRNYLAGLNPPALSHP